MEWGESGRSYCISAGAKDWREVIRRLPIISRRSSQLAESDEKKPRIAEKISVGILSFKSGHLPTYVHFSSKRFQKKSFLPNITSGYENGFMTVMVF